MLVQATAPASAKETSKGGLGRESKEAYCLRKRNASEARCLRPKAFTKPAQAYTAEELHYAISCVQRFAPACGLSMCLQMLICRMGLAEMALLISGRLEPR